MPVGGSDIHGPVAGAAHIGGAAFFECLIGAHFVAKIVSLSVLGDNLVAELVVEPFGGEIAFFLRHPLLQAHMGRYDELGHANLLVMLSVHCIPRPRPLRCMQG